MRLKGKIKQWNDAKGYGFISPMIDGEPVFVHIKSFSKKRRRPAVGDVVTYTKSVDSQQRLCASDVHLGFFKTKQTQVDKNTNISSIVAVIFLLLIGVLSMVKAVPVIIAMIYIFASFITYITYSIDKASAQSGSWRIPESTLHMMSFLGGWPGALVAQARLRHKTRKPVFRFVFYATIIMNGIFFIWLSTEDYFEVIEKLI
ncbi:MAG: cold shock and DUF1294 domain-containing protein, partial [Fulvivirga sp.]|uniref:cold shock and DUF1294 domain-containing protein n=1 Tax=Fulvivirga sp. TaxID=1931237 RepID=UPI0032EF25A7